MRVVMQKTKRKTEDESEVEGQVIRRPVSTTKLSNEEYLTWNVESGEATVGKVALAIDQLQ